VRVGEEGRGDMGRRVVVGAMIDGVFLGLEKYIEGEN